MEKDLNWAVLGTGVIANEMAQALQKMGKTMYAVANRTHEKAVAFAEKYGIAKVYDSIDEVFVDDEVDIIYITTPHNTHYKFMKAALQHGKHILVEKSITLNSKELNEMVLLAKQNHLVVAEAMTIWHMPLYKKLWEIIKNGELGKVQMITINFGSFKEYNMENRFFNMNLAGGAMLDIGVYALSMHSKQPKRAMISCEKGYIEIMEFPRAEKATIVDAVTGAKTEIDCGCTADALRYELTDMEQAVSRQNADDMKLAFSRDVMDIMTKIRKDWNMKYPGEDW